VMGRLRHIGRDRAQAERADRDIAVHVVQGWDRRGQRQGAR
jgi:hypothetical protein